MEPYRSSTLTLLECNLDDMSPEHLPYVLERLLEGGARDAWLTPILMKKGRPGHMLSVLLDVERSAALCEILFTETTTLGVRSREVTRYSLERSTETVSMTEGEVRVKVARGPDGRILNAAPEHEDCRALARASGRPLKDVFLDALLRWRADTRR